MRRGWTGGSGGAEPVCCRGGASAEAGGLAACGRRSAHRRRDPALLRGRHRGERRPLTASPAQKLRAAGARESSAGARERPRGPGRPGLGSPPSAPLGTAPLSRVTAHRLGLIGRGRCSSSGPANRAPPASRARGRRGLLKARGPPLSRRGGGRGERASERAGWRTALAAASGAGRAAAVLVRQRGCSLLML